MHVQLLLDDFDQFSRPKEVIEHHRRDFANEDTHEAEEALTYKLDLLLQQAVIELEFFVGGEEAHL